MDADWEVEVGGGAAAIDADWPGRADLAKEPQKVWDLEEVKEFRALGVTLLELNAAASPVYTAKCDVWELEEWPEAEELDAEGLRLTAGLGCYVDVLARARWQTVEEAVEQARVWVKALRVEPLPGARADLVVRLAVFQDGAEALGLTAYLQAVAEDKITAGMRLAQALARLAEAVSPQASGASGRLQIQ